ncbi:Hypothetical predicted protein [Olea europaea subsp. europaea]|uniref:DUF1985 domain-containing protein n=1 Tax=Olea europaea subsp. europaea TaxID=158383 RepID=A0A8S0R8L9_OLEEU|nr:Hypothetical predicted protein [Olea europaea subsp. europaea]
MRFGLQEYAVVTGLRCGLFSKGDDFNLLIERKRLKERYFKSNDKISLAQLQSTVARLSTTRADHYKLGLVLIVEGVFNASDNNVALQENFKRLRGGRRKRLHARCTTFPLPCRFGHTRQFWRLGNASVSESVNECHDFFAGPYESSHSILHVYATLRPTDAEAEQPYFSTLVPQDLDDRVRSGRSGDGETSGDDDIDGQSGSDRDGEDSEDHDGDDSEDTGESSTPLAAPVPSPVRRLMIHTWPVGTFASSLTRGEVEELLLDQRILFEMRLRIVKLEIQQHVTSECTRLRVHYCPSDPICPYHRSALNGRHCQARPTVPNVPILNILFHVTGRSQPPDRAYSHPCTDEEELLVGTEDLPEGADIAPCLDTEHEPLPTPIDDSQDGAATEPSHAAGVSDVEFDGCNVTDGEGKFIACVTSGYVTSA